MGRFKMPITQSIWENCLRRGILRAATPEQNTILRQWWTQGWSEMPIFPMSWGCNPVMHITNQTIGQTLDAVYPSITKASEVFGCEADIVKSIAAKQRPNILFAGELRLMKQIAEKELPYPPWTLFAADNTIQAYFNSKQELADYLQISTKTLDWIHSHAWNELSGGRWFWFERWGFFPISPRDEVLGTNWREEHSPNYSPDEI